MSEIIETYQQEQERLAKPELPGMAFATVVSVNEDGLELQFDGEDEASTKRFPCNTGVSFSTGQRVLLAKVNGSYVALCPVGWKGGGGGGQYDVFSVGHDGLVPGPTSAQTQQFLRGDGSWADPGGGGGSVTVSHYLKQISIGSVGANSVVSGTTSDSAPSGAFHMGIVGVYANSNYLVADAGISSMSDGTGGSVSISYHVGNPTGSARSGVTLSIMMRYLKFN